MEPWQYQLQNETIKIQRKQIRRKQCNLIDYGTCRFDPKAHNKMNSVSSLSAASWMQRVQRGYQIFSQESDQ